jgi:hypothetical protein
MGDGSDIIYLTDAIEERIRGIDAANPPFG